MRKRKWILPVIMLLLVFMLGTYGAAWLLMPSRTDFGATWETYLQEPRNSVDVLYFGSSLAYCNIVPGVIWEESGITSYVMAGPEQTIPITYRYIRETCKTQNPKAIVVEVTGMFYPEYCSFTKANISYMPWSANRVAAVIESAEPELRTGLLFPIFDYHSLWMSVKADQIKQHLAPGTDAFAGYTFLEKIVPQAKNDVRGFRADTEQYAENLEYLNRIYDFCQKNDMELLLVVTPAKNRAASAAMDQLEKDVAKMPEARFVDFNDVMDELGIDDSTDWYDSIHFNCRGAEKFSRYLSDFLQSELGLQSTEGEDELLWQSRVEHFATRRRSVE